MQALGAFCLAWALLTHGSMRSYPPQKGWSCVCGARASAAVGTSSRPVRVQTPRPNSADVKETAKARAGEGEPHPPPSPESPTDRPSAFSFLAASLNATIKDYI